MPRQARAECSHPQIGASVRKLGIILDIFSNEKDKIEGGD